MVFSRALLIVGLVSGLAGCALVDGEQRSLDISTGAGASLDINRRAILVAKHPPDTDATNANAELRVCAEPSPDGMTSVAASLSGGLFTPDSVEAQLAASLNEGAAFVGLRTQSIQLLRDAMYRSCEAYLSGGIDQAEYGLLLRRHQRYMLALLSIESLTGTIRAPTVTLSPTAMASAAQSVASMRKTVEQINEQVETLENENSELDRQIQTINDDGQKEAEAKAKEIEPLNNKKTENTKKVDALKSDIESIEKAIEENNGLLATGSVSVNVSNIGLPSNHSEAHIEKVTEAVVNITSNLTDMDDLGAKCIAYFSRQDPYQTTINSTTSSGDETSSLSVTQGPTGTLDEICEGRLQSLENRRRLEDEIIKKQFDIVNSNINQSIKSREKIIEIAFEAYSNNQITEQQLISLSSLIYSETNQVISDTLASLSFLEDDSFSVGQNEIMLAGPARRQRNDGDLAVKSQPGSGEKLDGDLRGQQRSMLLDLLMEKMSKSQ